ncbi:MBL fold metallo-hydrolase [Priestia aryabhattai]|uniref:MBL fold metallo-hydrolase n=1 Tax=Priestia aryabhattai TaxID=412384 RepID=UPI001C8DAE48|nr:MBL fold metallo-hydrolase [Priestia aryabhattai]MBX9968292.1 MBL fold metallo-hydrolase [Priestia aryabhattai]
MIQFIYHYLPFDKKAFIKLHKAGVNMLKKLTDHIYYFPHSKETDRPVLGLICGEKYSFVVDAGNSPAHASAFLEEVENLGAPPIKGVAITHWHWDHTFGIHAMNKYTISHHLTKKKLAYLKTLRWDDDSLDKRVQEGEEIEFCRDMIKKEMPCRETLILQEPDVTFHHHMEVDLGGITCCIQHIGGVHAQDSSVVYVPQEKVLFLGDCLCPDFYSGDWSYDKEDLERIQRELQTYDAEYYLSSHFDPETSEELWRDLNQLSAIGEIVENEVDLEKACFQFECETYKKPTNEQKERIQYFVNGNVKRKSRELF